MMQLIDDYIDKILPFYIEESNMIGYSTDGKKLQEYVEDILNGNLDSDYYSKITGSNIRFTGMLDQLVFHVDYEMYIDTINRNIINIDNETVASIFGNNAYIDDVMDMVRDDEEDNEKDYDIVGNYWIFVSLKNKPMIRVKVFKKS